MARRVAAYAPYDLDDYLQQGLVAAFDAWVACSKKGETDRYHGYVVVAFRRACERNLGICRDAPASIQDADRARSAAHPQVVTRTPFEILAESQEGPPAPRRPRRLEEALGRMTPRQRHAWTLALGYGESADDRIYARVAADMSVSVRAVRRLLHRGIERVSGMAAEKTGR